MVFALCVTFFYLAFDPVQQRGISFRHKVNQLLENKNIKFSFIEKSPDLSEQLVAFYRFFPKLNTVSDWIAKLYDAAVQQNLILDTGEYQLVPARDGQLIRYDITLPVKGSYLQIRKFVAQALEDVPSLALGGITFNRQKIDDAFVDAQIRFTLYLGEE